MNTSLLKNTSRNKYEAKLSKTKHGVCLVVVLATLVHTIPHSGIDDSGGGNSE